MRAADATETAHAVSLLARPAPEAVPVPSTPPLDLTVFLASLARGGAERVVVRWLALLDPRRHRVRLVVMGRAPAEYPVPAHVRVERLAGDRGRAQLAALAEACARVARCSVTS